MSDQPKLSDKDELAKLLVDTCLSELRNNRADSSFLQVCRQVVNDSGADYLASAADELSAKLKLPPRPNLKKLG